MKTLLALMTLTLAVSLPVQAQRALETRDEARQRHSAQNYEKYRQNGHSAPLGGYRDKLGDPAPQGTQRPGHITPKGGSYTPYGNSKKRF